MQHVVRHCVARGLLYVAPKVDGPARNLRSELFIVRVYIGSVVATVIEDAWKERAVFLHEIERSHVGSMLLFCCVMSTFHGFNAKSRRNQVGRLMLNTMAHHNHHHHNADCLLRTALFLHEPTTLVLGVNGK